jgi:hypothetical protein
MHFAADHSVGFFHALDGDEKKNLFRGQIEVGIDEDDEFASSRLRPASQGRALARMG